MRATVLGALFFAGSCGVAIAGGDSALDPRMVQISGVDFEAGVLEVTNFDSVDADLSGWRFCSHDFNEQRRYSSSSGLNGVTVPAGGSLFVHFNNDAVGVDAVNRSSLGSFALPLDSDAYGIQLYFPAANGSVSFGNSALIADHVQWNIDGSGVGQAQARTNQAVSQGLWTASGDFVSTTLESVRIDLDDTTGGTAHGPSSYSVLEPVLDPRNVQISGVDFENGILEITNFDGVDADLSGWRFCSHDFNEGFRYSSSSGLNGVTIVAGGTLSIHFNNDASGADAINRTSVGSFALPLDSDAYGIQLYFPAASGAVSFGNSALIADHTQWNIDGSGVGSAETRTAQAVSEGLWTASGDFVSTTSDSLRFELNDLTGGTAHGPASYTVFEPGLVGCNPADLNDAGSPSPAFANFGVPDGIVSPTDFSAFSFFFSTGDLRADINDAAAASPAFANFGVPDGILTPTDFSAFAAYFGAGCPCTLPGCP